MFRIGLALILVGVLEVMGAQPPKPADLPPMPPSPLQQFRSWLQMPEAERETELAKWPEEKRKILREKLQVYSSLPEPQRERRLDMLELRWYLRPLMSLSATQRAERLKAVPPPIQPLVLDRLNAWDQLDEATRHQILENEETQELVVAYFAQIRRGVPQEEILRTMDEMKRARLRKALETWAKTSPGDRRRMAEFFELPAKEQQRALDELSPEEKKEMEGTLKEFARLSPQQRRVCVDSFQKFAAMTPSDRSQFLRNAARWNAMTPQERETWKQLVRKLPPLPPEPAPPFPPSVEGRRVLAGTNAIAR